MDSLERGYAVSLGLFHEAMTSIGIPIFDSPSNVVAVIMGAFMIHGLAPGPMLMVEHPYGPMDIPQVTAKWESGKPLPKEKAPPT